MTLPSETSDNGADTIAIPLVSMDGLLSAASSAAAPPLAALSDEQIEDAWSTTVGASTENWPAVRAFAQKIWAAAGNSQSQDAARTLPSLSFAELIDSEAFKHTLNALADRGNNPKHQRALVREVRDAIKACAQAQRQASAAELYGAATWIKLEAAMPEPYEEVRILFDGVPRIARLNHARSYFQLCTFLDNVKHQYIAPLDRVAGWQPLPGASAAIAAMGKQEGGAA